MLAANAVFIEQILADPQNPLPREKLPVIKEAAIAACDAADGVTDRIVADPLACSFDPAILRCKTSEAPGCLTVAQIDAVRRLYRGPVNPRTGEIVAPGPTPGSEPAWGGGSLLSQNYFRNVIFDDQDWSAFAVDFDADIARAREIHDDVLAKPDLRDFTRRGGKLILWHGWTDGVVPARISIEYFEAVAAAADAEDVGEHVRLFMVPGVDHCGGGEGTFLFDAVDALEQWVEKNKAPEVILARRPLEGGAMRTRPVCAYPQTARFKGSGDADDAANFECRSE
jgi:feruloyl esterase